MFVDAVWANVLVFAVGQAFAWLYARSGRFWLGAGATVTLWVAADWWLVGRYLLGASAAEQVLPVAILQLTSVATTGAFLWAQLRRRQGRATRAERHRHAIQRMLGGDHDAAVATFRQLVWSDGWDAAAWVGLGDALRRAGDVTAARRSYARADAVDLANAFADLLSHRRQLLDRPQRQKKTAPPAGGPEVAGGRKGQRRKAAAKARSAG